MQFADVSCALKTQTAIIIAYSSLPFRKKAQRRPSTLMQTAAFGFMLYLQQWESLSIILPDIVLRFLCISTTPSRIQTIQSIVGHADTEMTEHYLHVQESIRQSAIQLFSEAFSA